MDKKEIQEEIKLKFNILGLIYIFLNIIFYIFRIDLNFKLKLEKDLLLQFYRYFFSFLNSNNFYGLFFNIIIIILIMKIFENKKGSFIILFETIIFNVILNVTSLFFLIILKCLANIYESFFLYIYEIQNKWSICGIQYIFLFYLLNEFFIQEEDVEKSFEIDDENSEDLEDLEDLEDDEYLDSENDKSDLELKDFSFLEDIFFFYFSIFVISIFYFFQIHFICTIFLCFLKKYDFLNIENYLENNRFIFYLEKSFSNYTCIFSFSKNFHDKKIVKIIEKNFENEIKFYNGEGENQLLKNTDDLELKVYEKDEELKNKELENNKKEINEKEIKEKEVKEKFIEEKIKEGKIINYEL